MTDEPPWEDYSRDRLRSGTSYPAGRDFVERCLRDAAVVIGSLSFVGGASDPRSFSPERRCLVDLFWFGDVRSTYPRRSRAGRLFLRLWAVPSIHRREASRLLVDGLPFACQWAAAATERGYGWSTSQHVLTLWHVSRGLEVEET